MEATHCSGDLLSNLLSAPHSPIPEIGFRPPTTNLSPIVVKRA